MGMRIISSLNLPEDQLIAADADNLMIFGEAPEIDLSSEAMITMSTDPANDVAPEVRSLFQTRCTGLRLVVGAGWQKIRAGCVALVTGVA